MLAWVTCLAPSSVALSWSLVARDLAFQVKILTQNENSKLQAALVSNLKSAVTAAFLMLPESFSEEDLYMQIAGLSYSG